MCAYACVCVCVRVFHVCAHACVCVHPSSTPGVDVNSQDSSGIPAALAAAAAADVIILVLGNDRTQEHETLDRTDTALPGLQEPFAMQVFALNKPVVMVLTNGGALAIDNLMTQPCAIVEAFNPGVGGAVPLAHALFGLENRWGKLPITM